MSRSKSPPVLTNSRRCSGCGRCVAACPQKLYTLEETNRRKISVNLNPERCILCSRCISECPLALLSDGETNR